MSQTGVAIQVQMLISLRHAHRRTVESSGHREGSRQYAAVLPSPSGSHAWRRHS